MSTEALAERYNFADFTLSKYRHLLRLAKKAYEFRGFTTFDRHERFVLWRHDVDFSLHSARNLARIEKEEAVRATYFVNPHSEFYNPFEREESDCIREILRDGHELGLHFDVHYYGISAASELDEAVRREALVLENVFGAPVKVFSFHNTNAFTMASQAWTYGGLVNTYAEYFQKQVGYCSDSNGFWRFRRLSEVLEAASDERLQVLTHDAWWQAEAASPRARVYRSILGRAAKVSTGYATLLSQADRPNISELAETFDFARRIDPDFGFRLETLWFWGSKTTLVGELFQVHGRQLVSLSRAHLAAKFGVSSHSIDAFLARLGACDSRDVFRIAVGREASDVTGLSNVEHDHIADLLRRLFRSVSLPTVDEVTHAIERLTVALGETASWGLANEIADDGLDQLRSSPRRAMPSPPSFPNGGDSNAEWQTFVESTSGYSPDPKAPHSSALSNQ